MGGEGGGGSPKRRDRAAHERARAAKTHRDFILTERIRSMNNGQSDFADFFFVHPALVYHADIIRCANIMAHHKQDELVCTAKL